VENHRYKVEVHPAAETHAPNTVRKMKDVRATKECWSGDAHNP